MQVCSFDTGVVYLLRACQTVMPAQAKVFARTYLKIHSEGGTTSNGKPIQRAPFPPSFHVRTLSFSAPEAEGGTQLAFSWLDGVAADVGSPRP